MPSRLLLVRHGQSEWNAVGRWQGQADPPLTDVGRAQARAAARAIGSVDGVFSSDLQRARETADVIAERIGVGPVIADPGLRERDAGEWSGLTRNEINERYPGYLPDDRHRTFAPSRGNDLKRPPGWESDEDVLARVLDAIQRVDLVIGDGDGLVVTHGGVIYVLEGLLGAPFARLANGGGRWIDVEGESLTLGHRVLLVNDDGTPVTVPTEI
jgi:probable phosphoglycerate mutase